jgi:hypothetical protein
MTHQVLRRRRQEAAAFLHATKDLPADLRGTYALLLNLMLANGGQIEDRASAIAEAIGCDSRTWQRRRADLIERGMICAKNLQGNMVICNAVNGIAKKTTIAKPAAPAFAESRAPIAPDARVQHFADLVNSDRPVTPGSISVVMLQTLIDTGLVSKRRLKQKGLAP